MHVNIPNSIQYLSEWKSAVHFKYFKMTVYIKSMQALKEVQTCNALSISPTGPLTSPGPTTVQSLPGYYNLFGIFSSPCPDSPIL